MYAVVSVQRRLLYFVPAVATLVAAYALLGPGRGLPIVGCRLLAGDDADGLLRSVRLQLVEKLGGYEEPRGADGVRVTVGGTVVFDGPVPASGLLELRLSGGAASGGAVVVERAGTSLAVGRVESPKTAPPRAGDGARGASTGAFAIRVELPRGVLSPPFGEKLRVVATSPDGTPVQGLLKLESEGAGLPTTPMPLDSQGAALVSVTPIAQTVELEATVDATPAGTAKWSGELPVAIGSVWLDERSTRKHLELAVRAPHKEAYVSLYDDRGRFGGVVIPLAAAADGIYRGSADVDSPTEKPITAVVATDPQERGLTTVAWPVDPPVRTLSPGPLRRVLDGLPAAERREADRLGRVRRITTAFLGAAALLEILLLVLESRRTRRDLTSHFERNADEDEALPESSKEARIETSKLVVPRGETAVVTVSVALLLLLSAATLAALNFVGR